MHVQRGTHVVDILGQTLACISWSVQLNHHFEPLVASFRVKLVADPLYLVEVNLKHVDRMFYPRLGLIRFRHFGDLDLLFPGLLFFEQRVAEHHELKLHISPLNLLLLRFGVLI